MNELQVAFESAWATVVKNNPKVGPLRDAMWGVFVLGADAAFHVGQARGPIYLDGLIETALRKMIQ